MTNYTNSMNCKSQHSLLFNLTGSSGAIFSQQSKPDWNTNILFNQQPKCRPSNTRAKQEYVRILLFVINRGRWNWHKHQDPLSVSDNYLIPKTWAIPVINLQMNLENAITVTGRIKYIKWLQESLMAVIKFNGWQPDVHWAESDLHNRRGEAAADLVWTSHRQLKEQYYNGWWPQKKSSVSGFRDIKSLLYLLLITCRTWWLVQPVAQVCSMHSRSAVLTHLAASGHQTAVTHCLPC